MVLRGFVGFCVLFIDVHLLAYSKTLEHVYAILITLQDAMNVPELDLTTATQHSNWLKSTLIPSPTVQHGQTNKRAKIENHQLPLCAAL